MRLLLALAAGKKLKLEHFDVTNAFTQSDIDSEIYVEPPRGFEKYDENGKSCVLKLKRALYGTKQASRRWQEKLAEHLTVRMGFKRSTNDPCMYVKRGHAENRRYCMLMSADNLYETTKLQAWILTIGPSCGLGEPKFVGGRPCGAVLDHRAGVI